MDPDMSEGLAALRLGLFYFVRSAEAVARLVGLDDVKEHLVSEYAGIKDLAEAELDKVLQA